MSTPVRKAALTRMTGRAGSVQEETTRGRREGVSWITELSRWSGKYCLYQVGKFARIVDGAFVWRPGRLASSRVSGVIC